MNSSPSLPATASSTIMNHPNPQSLKHSTSRRAKPSHVQTSFLPSLSSTPSVPASAISASSIATSSSVQASPIMSPETTQIITNNSSISGSPEGPRGRESEFPTPQFDLLPESIVSRKSSQSAMSEAVQISKSPGLIRRLSNRASQFAGRRRQSSATAMSRDNSSGPVIMRRRSDSTNTAPDGAREAAAFFYNSDEDDDLLRKEPGSYLGLGIDTALRDYPSTTASVSSNGASVGSTAGPVIPATLLQGTTMVKVTKKKKKLLTFVLENEAAKVTWDKNRPAKSFYIDDIKEIRTAKNAENYLREFGVNVHDESRFFSILYAVPDKSKGRAQKVMHLIASDEQTFELWITTLDAISKHREKMMASLSSFNEKAVKAYWRNEMTKQFHDKPHSEEEEDIDIAGLERLCRSLHIHGSSNYFRSKFSQADTQGTGRLNFTEFQEFVKLMKRREDVRALYRDLVSESDKGLTLDQFLGFLRDIQGENVDLDRTHWENIFAKFVRQSKTKEKALQDAADGEIARMNESALTSYLISTFNVPLNNAPPKSLDRPLNEYFITSSHNTYLLGRQVAGESSVEAYISALNKGCRCVEVDCWNGSDGEPVVMHGRTLTSQVSFADVMSTISKYAFSKTPYPLWISLEVHCSPVQQEKMARIIREKCRPYLIEEPIDNSGELPTPQQLLNRILIKVKKPRHFEAVPVMENSSGRSRGSSLSSPYVRPTQLDNSTVSAGLLPPSSYSRTTPGSYARTRIVSRGQFKGSGSEGPDSGLSSSTSDSEGTPEEFPKPNGSTGKTSNIIKVLGELGVYSAGLKFRGFDSPESKAYNHIFSFMENTFDKNSKTQEERRAIARHNMRHMMRVYPNGWRVASTNFDPLRYWRRGVQMVALNWQTYDLGMQMNDAMFAAGPDQSGYVLKPSDMREIKMITTVPEEAGAGHVKRERKNVNFSIEVISAQQLMRPKGLATTRTVDPYIEVEVYHADDKSKESRGVVGDGGLDASGKDGASGLGSPHRRRTQIVQENGFNPIFDKKFNFELTTKYPDLVFVRWTVRCSQDGFTYNNDRTAPLATYTAKLSSLQQGYRTLPLVDGNGDKFLFSTLFCRIKIEPATSIYINEVSESVGVFKRVFNRTPVSPRIPENNHQ